MENRRNRRREQKFDDRADAQQLAQPVEAFGFEKLKRGKVNKYPKSDFYKIVDSYREQEIMEIHGYCEAEFECVRERALAAKAMFMEEYRSYVEFVEAMSDGYFNRKELGEMGEIEYELMEYAYKLRETRLNAENLRFKKEQA